MWERLRLAIARQGTSVRRRTGRVRALLGLLAAKREQGRQERRVSAARTRFWSDLHEGQREAQVLAAEPHKKGGE